MGISSFQFRPGWIPTIFVVLLSPMFVGLGFWQLDRAEQKRAMAAAQDSRRKQPPLRLDDNKPSSHMVSYRRLIAQGRFLADKTVFIENRKYQGKTGYHVITPLCTSPDRLCLLVNRGWVDATAAEGSLDLMTPDQPVEVTGEAVVPEPPALNLQSEGSAVKSRRWPFVTIDAYRDWSQLDLYPFMLLQSPDDSHGFVRNWPMAKPNHAMHIGYAIQWFAFALIALTVWLTLSLQRSSPSVDSQ